MIHQLSVHGWRSIVDIAWQNGNLIYLTPQNSTDIHCFKAVAFFSEAFQKTSR